MLSKTLNCLILYVDVGPAQKYKTDHYNTFTLNPPFGITMGRLATQRGLKHTKQNFLTSKFDIVESLRARLSVYLSLLVN